MKERFELKIILKTDEILDSNEDIRNSSKEILLELIKGTKARGGTILIYDSVDGNLKILAKVGRMRKELAKKSFRKGKCLIKGRELSVPVMVRREKLGLVYLFGKNFSKEDLEYVSSSELILDGRFKHEINSHGLRNIFEKYVGERTMRKILSKHDKESLKGEKKMCSILFADINGFTAYANKETSKHVIKLLDEYFEEMSKVILKKEGTIDKFIGDGIMVVFGSPIYQKDHAERAISVAKELIRKSRKIIKKYNLPKSGISIGIASGKVIAGNIGSKKMIDYTVIGRKVNLASRLTSFAGKNQILIDDSTKKLGKCKNCKELGQVELKGFPKKVNVFKVKL